MKRRYQVIYRAAGDNGAKGPLATLEVVAEKQEEAEAVVRTQPDLTLVAVLPGLAVVDWGKPIYSIEEVAEACNRSHDFVTRQQGKGLMPKNPKGVPVLPARVLTEFAEEGKAA